MRDGIFGRRSERFTEDELKQRSLFDEAERFGLARIENPGQIDVDHFLPLLRGHLLGGRRVGDAGRN